MTAPAMPRTMVEAARQALEQAEEAWRKALQDAVGNHGEWGHVRQAAEVTSQARSTLRAAEETAGGC